MRYIRNISDDQNKAGDTDNIFRFNLLQGEDIFNFGDYPISINIANSSGYILSMVPEKEFGNSVLKLDFNDQSLKSLTPDNYLLEVEVKLPDGTTATFPTKGGMPFTVNSNLKNTAGQLVPTVTFDTVLEAVDKKINNYLATVVKGETGPVGPTGEVDTSKDYTFTGNNTFTQPINGALATRVATFTDFAVVARNMDAYAGNWVVKGTHINNSPLPDDFYYTVEVLPGDFKGSGKIILTPYDGNNITETIFYSIVNWRGILNWQQLALDSTLVHNTGTETIAGNKQFTDGLFANWGIELKAATPYVDFHFNNDDGDYTSRIIEATKGTLSINGVNINGGTISGSLNGNSSSATKLAAPRNINGVAFDGTSDVTIDPSTRQISTATDLFTLANGFYYNAGVASTNKPAATSNYFVVEVIQTPTNGFMRLIDNNGLSFWTTKSSSNWGAWHQDADDSTVVHNTGTETVTGDKTFTGTNTFTGKTSFWFKQIQWTSGIMQGTWYIQRMGNWVNAKFDMSADTGTGTTALTLPVGYRPISAFSRELEQGVSGIKRDGTLYISTAYTGSNAMTFSYPTNDIWPTA